ncbi:MAG: peptidoglycan-binding domain-containing protein, partial [Syntrophomonas sp.]|nr:peptidoglycan-binding domain-containing protein [Syntrophomonas sp.]
MLTLRCKQLFFLGVLALLMVVIIPLSAQASDYGTKDLTLGSQGSAVSQLQKDLSGLGFYTNSIDGSFGPKTYNAVVNFQKSQGLKTDGVVGPKTKAALNAVLTGTVSSSPVPTIPPPVSDITTVPVADSISDYGTKDLTLGSQGSAVSQLQKDLSGLGFYTNSIDGSFGPKT